MQKITISEIYPPTEEKKPTIIVDESGARMSGFDTKLRSLTIGSIIEVELEIKGKYINIKEWKMISEAKEGQPIATTGGRQYQDSPEKTTSIERQVAAKLAFEYSDASESLEAVLNKAEKIYRWIGQKVTISTTPKDAVKKTAATVKSTAPDIEQAERDSRELFSPGGSDGLSAEEVKHPVKGESEEHIPGAIDMDILKDQMKELHWTEGTFKTWLVSMGRKQQWGEIDISGTLTEVIGKLNVEQRELICKEIQGLIDLK